MLKRLYPTLELGDTVYIKKAKIIGIITAIHGNGKNKVYFVNEYFDGFFNHELQKV